MLTKNHLLVFSVSCILFTAMLLFYSFYIVEGIRTLPMSIEVGKNYGLNTDTDKLYFGRTVPGGEAFRGFAVESLREYPLKVTIVRMGELGRWISLKEKSFVLGPRGNKTIEATVYVPKDASYGNYSGSLRVIFKKKW